MKITSDWHIHSRNSCDEAALTVADLSMQAGKIGILDFGLTDHVHTPFNLPDITASRAEYVQSKPSARFHFGVEAGCVSRWELDELRKGGHANPVYGLRAGGPARGELAIGITQEDIARYQVEYVVGGTHWPMFVPFERESVIRDYHRQNMFLATHPLVDIVAHPWWWMGRRPDASGKYPAEPWLMIFAAYRFRCTTNSRRLPLSIKRWSRSTSART
jgi:histidinol phosphatase-like PHP family hydrolase